LGDSLLHARPVFLAVVAAIAIVSACSPSDSVGTRTPTQIVPVSGSSQSALVGTALAAPLVVLVTDADGEPVSGVTVNWAVATGGGSVSAATSNTGENGQAEITWTLGPTAGSQSATATVSGLTGSPVTFLATATNPPPTQIAVVSGNGQSAAVSTALGAPLVVVVTNANGGPVSGVTVNWAVATGGGSVAAATSSTGANGQAQMTWTLGSTAGAQTATATVSGLTGSPVTFTATATSLPATQIALVSGNNQSAAVSTAVGAPLVVAVTNTNGAAVSGVTVNWAVATGGGSVAAATSSTAANGQAQMTWTLGSTVGAQTATASVSGLTGSPVTFTATATSSGSTRVQRYISPTGNDANNGQTAATPWRTFAKAFGPTGIPGGGELILLDGTYSVAAGTGYISFTGTGSAQPPSGPGRAFEQNTWVHAQTTGKVTVVGPPPAQRTGNGPEALFIGRSARKDSNITIQGILFDGGGSLFNTQYVTVKESGFYDVPEGGGSVFGVGTSSPGITNSYAVIEDSWIWGKNRIIAIAYRADHVVWRRVVIRGDGCGTTSCTGSGNPNVGITTYESKDVSLQNVIVIDRILGGGTPYADFATAMHTTGQQYGNIEWLGTISLNSGDAGYYFEPDMVTAEPAHTVRNCVAWNPTLFGFNLDRTGNAVVENCTIKLNSTLGSGDGLRIGPAITGTSVRNIVVIGTGRYAMNSKIQPSFVNVFGTWTGNYNQTTCATGCRTTDPMNDGATPSLKWPLRIEAGSALFGTGFGGANYGATVVNRYGTDGARHGDPNFNTLTTTPLWPWPNQATIKTQMCAGVTRGWCGTSQTLTEYIWGQTGNGLPPGITP
jgi:hypothetical protein